MKAKSIIVLSLFALLVSTVAVANISNQPKETNAGVSHTVQFGSEYNSAKISSYTSSWSVTCDNTKYNLANWNNNNNEWNYVKAGSKKSASIATFSTTATFSNPISKIVFTFDKWTSSSVTSTTLYTATNSGFTENLNSKTLTIVQGDNAISIDGASSDLFYKLEISIAKASSNGIIQMSKVVFNEIEQKLAAPTNISFNNSTKTLTWDAVENADSYELTVKDEATTEKNVYVYTSTTNSYDFSPFADDTYLVSIVAKDSTGSYSDSTASDTRFTIETSGPKLTSITYEGTPKIQYIGKEFDYEGLTFAPHYDSDNPNPEEILGSDIKWPELAEGMTSITGTYRGISVTIDPIVVKEDVVESIEISGDMTNKNYVTGQESFDSTGLTVTGTYSSGETKNVTAESTFTFEKTPSEVGATTGTSITVNVEYNGLTSSKTINDIVISKTTVDVITADKLAATSITYTSFSDLKINDAVYAGSTSNNNGAIQLRSRNSDSGIYSTKTGGLVTKVSIEWQNGSNTLDVYGKNEPYTAVGDLYSSSSQGTKIGSITSGSTTELSINGNYHYIGLRSNNGVLYIKSITITYVADTASTLAEYIMSENTEGQCKTKFPVANDIYQMLTDEEKAKFVSSSSDETIVNAVARYEAWAISLNVTNPYEAYTTANGTLINSKENKNVIIYASVFGIASIVTVLAFCLRRKKRA